MAARWRIVSDIPRQDLTAQGRFEDFRHITFEEQSTGRQGEVMVAVRNYTPEFVSSVVQEYADRILAMAQLGSGG